MHKLFRRLFSRRPAPSSAETQPAPKFVVMDADVDALRAGTGLPMGGVLDRLDWAQRDQPGEVAATLAAAERLLSHQFSLLGARFESLDPARSAVAGGYRPLDWHLDPVSGLRFPTGFEHRRWDMATMRPGSADIKLPWELARCQHWPVLAQAWSLSGDRRYAEEIARQLHDFVDSNPVGIGVNWVCTMDVALRAANWALALQWLREWDPDEAGFWTFACEQLLAHGHFIRDNLEDKYEVTSNHFLSNVVGLLYVAAVFSERPQGATWLEWCVGMLEREIGVQVLEDGADFESSIPYHRLVTELFLGAHAACSHLGRPLSGAYVDRLKSMVSYLLGVLRPDGLMPQLGDADDGRLHILSGYGVDTPQDPRHLFGPAAALLQCPDWARHAGPRGAWETFWWGLDPASVPLAELSPPDHACWYPQAGVCISRRGGNFLMVSNARVGTEGFGNHKHNDQLGFELHIAGDALIVDAGSHVYTGNPASRNAYRSTANHNTLMVDGVEQNEVNPEWLFRLFEKAEAEMLEFSSEESHTRYRGRHRGYARLSEPVIHERSFEHRLEDGALIVEDELQGDGEHDLHWHFHLAPGVTAVPAEDGAGVLLSAAGSRALLTAPADLRPEIRPGGYSPSYGVEQPCVVIDYRCRIKLAGRRVWRFGVQPLQAAAQ